MSASRRLLEEAEDLLPQPRLCITSRAPDSTKAKLSDANVLLRQYDHIGYTGSITVGVNYDLRNHLGAWSTTATSSRQTTHYGCSVRIWSHG